jgi:hypothetical protein
VSHKKLLPPLLSKLIEACNINGFWPESAKKIFDKFARSGDCHEFRNAEDYEDLIKSIKQNVKCGKIKDTVG